MSSVLRASVLICTYNRASLLRETLAALQAMDPVPDCAVEIIVVDNNSNDDTRGVIAESATRGRLPVIYVQELRQGKSFALNEGLRHATGDIIALTDDDVLPAADWLERLLANFRARDVSFVFGKVLPRWEAAPPPELLDPRAQQIWGPLALVDYGDEPLAYLPESTAQRLPIGANLAFTAAAVRRIGGWRTDLGKVNNSLISGEDYEIFTRLRRADLYSGFYDPGLVVHHYVPASRVAKRYLRKWFFWQGKTHARILPDLYLDLDLSAVPHVAGTPRFLYREAVGQIGRWLASLGRGDRLTRLIEELRVMRYAGLLWEGWNRRAQSARDDVPAASGVSVRS